MSPLRRVSGGDAVERRSTGRPGRTGRRGAQPSSLVIWPGIADAVIWGWSPVPDPFRVCANSETTPAARDLAA